jgi:hypothetical protein
MNYTIGKYKLTVDIVGNSVEADLFDAEGVKVMYFVGFGNAAYALTHNEGFTFYPQYSVKHDELALRMFNGSTELAALYTVTHRPGLAELELAILESLMAE